MSPAAESPDPAVATYASFIWINDCVVRTAVWPFRVTISLISLWFSSRPATYTVRLHFAEVQNAPPGGRVFDVTLQGRRVLAKLDVAKEAGGPNRAVVKEFKGVRVKDDLRIGLKAHRGHPMLAAVEVIREEK